MNSSACARGATIRPISAALYSNYLRQADQPAQGRRADILRHARIPEADGRREGRHRRRRAPMDHQIQAADRFARSPARRDDRLLPGRRAARSAPSPISWNKSTRTTRARKDSKLKELNEAKAETYDVDWPVESGSRAAEIQLRRAQRHCSPHHDSEGRRWSPSAAMSTSRPRTRRTRSNEYREGTTARPGVRAILLAWRRA